MIILPDVYYSMMWGRGWGARFLISFIIHRINCLRMPMSFSFDDHDVEIAHGSTACFLRCRFTLCEPCPHPRLRKE